MRLLAVPGTVGRLLLSNSTAAQMTPYGAQEMPPANNAARVQITEGPTLESFRNNEAIITWTSNNPGGADEQHRNYPFGALTIHGSPQNTSKYLMQILTLSSVVGLN